MSGHAGRRARWTSALVVLPGAAGLLAGLTAWATQARPASAGTPNTTSSKVTSTPARGLSAAQASVVANRRELAQLQRQLDVLRSQVAGQARRTSPAASRVASPGAGHQPSPKTDDAPPVVVPGTDGAPPAPGSAAPAPGSAAPTTRPPAPAPTPTPAPTPPRTSSSSAPPPTQTSTGASLAAG